jgi:hypothetical protein
MPLFSYLQNDMFEYCYVLINSSFLCFSQVMDAGLPVVVLIFSTLPQVSGALRPSALIDIGFQPHR